MGTRLPWFSYLVVFFCFVPAITFSFGQQLSPRPLITKPVVESELTTLKGNTHPLAQPQFDVGVAPPDLPMSRMLLVLKRSPEQDYALHTLLDNQQDKASAHYHKWLTPDEFGTQFGPADQDVQTVTGWLQSHGFQVNRVSHGRTVIEFSGTEAQVEEALHTSIHKFSVNGEEHWANATDPQIPSALAPVVAGIWSLHNFRKQPHIHYSSAPVHFERGTRGEVTFPNPPGPDIHALGPQDYATIYNINPVYQSGINGQGKTIAVVGRSQIDMNDLFSFFSVFQLNPSVTVVNDGPPPPSFDGGGEQLEATLDATWSAAIAPGANVDFVLSSSTNTSDGVDLSEVYIVDNDLGNVMTESFGICEANFTSTEAQGFSLLAEQAAAQGITYIVSTGDTGSAGCDFQAETVARGPVSVNILASTPYTVAVGGTMFNEGANDSKYWNSNPQSIETALSYIPENVWNESCTEAQCGIDANILAGGGGASTFFTKPPWQSPTLWPTLNIPNDGVRDIPDVSLTAAGHDPYLLCIFGSCQNNFIYFVYGTSAAAPSFAGIMALVDQKLNASQGQADYTLYSLASKETFSQCNGSNGLPSSNTCVFNDVTVGNNAVPGESSYGSTNPRYASGPAYDLATGLGSVNVKNLVNAWASANFYATTTTISFASGNPTTVTHGTPVMFNVNVDGNSGTPSGDVSVNAVSQNTTQSKGIGFATLNNGTAAVTTDVLPGGALNISAYYPGDGKFAPSPPSNTLALTVTPENSTTTIEAIDQNGTPFTSGTYGSFVYVRADVKGNSGQGTPTGIVNFNLSEPGGGSFVQLGLNSEGNTAMLNGATNYPVGKTTIVADYYGDASFNPSSAPSLSFSISKASTSTGVQSAGAPQGALLTATIGTGSLGFPPTGSVSFFSGATNLGSAFITSGGSLGAIATASLNATQLTNGQYTITANYTGDTNYTASTSAPTPITIQPDFSVQLSTDALPIQTPGRSGSLTVTMTDLDGFTGNVSFSCSGLPSESKCQFSPASLSSTGSTNLTITTTAKTGALQQLRHKDRWTLALALSGALIPGIFVFGIPVNKRRRNLLLTIVLGILCVSCGGGGGSSMPPPPPPNPGTPQGIYIVTLIASSGSTTHSVYFGLGVF
jgi:hypothetical protein